MQAFDRQEMVTRATRLAKRIANFVRPKPRTIPLGVEEVLASSAGRELVERFVEFCYRWAVPELSGNISGVGFAE